MKLIAAVPGGGLEVIPTTEDKEMQIEYNGIQFKDSLKLISSPLRRKCRSNTMAFNSRIR